MRKRPGRQPDKQYLYSTAATSLPQPHMGVHISYQDASWILAIQTRCGMHWKRVLANWLVGLLTPYALEIDGWTHLELGPLDHQELAKNWRFVGGERRRDHVELSQWLGALRLIRTTEQPTEDWTVWLVGLACLRTFSVNRFHTVIDIPWRWTDVIWRDIMCKTNRWITLQGLHRTLNQILAKAPNASAAYVSTESRLQSFSQMFQSPNKLAEMARRNQDLETGKGLVAAVVHLVGGVACKPAPGPQVFTSRAGKSSLSQPCKIRPWRRDSAGFTNKHGNSTSQVQAPG